MSNLSIKATEAASRYLDHRGYTVLDVPGRNRRHRR